MKVRYEIKKVECENEKCPMTKCKGLDDCKFGDTKEQLISKIATAVRISTNDLGPKKIRKCAKDVVEYLGIKE